jgi:hypothetical protein
MGKRRNINEKTCAAEATDGREHIVSASQDPVFSFPYFLHILITALLESLKLEVSRPAAQPLLHVGNTIAEAPSSGGPAAAAALAAALLSSSSARSHFSTSSNSSP